ncbi:Lid2 complex component snt2 [Mycena venus]|uniref:Lid2 complex component snt2 n=1 Tax=Mycena venus TaxID=2733690 RepID=A0A8H7DBV7_9AGAR|nr:Lid2 complex component snt2 [Mycena venus]
MATGTANPQATQTDSRQSLQFGRPQDILTTSLPSAELTILSDFGSMGSRSTPAHFGPPGAALRPNPNPNPNSSQTEPSTPTWGSTFSPTLSSFGPPGSILRTPSAGPSSPSAASPAMQTFSFGTPGPALRVPSGLVSATMSTLSIPALGAPLSPHSPTSPSRLRTLLPKPGPVSGMARFRLEQTSTPAPTATSSHSQSPAPHSQSHLLPYAQSQSHSHSLPAASSLHPATTSSSGITKSKAKAKAKAKPAAHNTAGMDSSPLSSLPSSPASSSRGGTAPAPSTLPWSWWVGNGYGRGHGYGENQNQNHVNNRRPMNMEVNMVEEMVAYAEEKEEARGKQKEIVTYMSRAKAESADGSVSGKSANSRSDSGRHRLFIPSPKIPHANLASLLPPAAQGTGIHRRTRAVHTLAVARGGPVVHTPSVIPTPPAPPRPPPPGVGVARKVVRDHDVNESQKRKREVMSYVFVPPAPYAVKRPRTDTETVLHRGRGVRKTYGGRGRRSESGGYSDQSRSRSREVKTWTNKSRGQWWSESRGYSAVPVPRRKNNDQWDGESDGESAISRSRTKNTAKAKEKNEGEVHLSLGDALNNAWANNESTGTFVGQAKGKRKEREITQGKARDRPQKRDRKEDEVEDGPRKRVKTEGRGAEQGIILKPTMDGREQPEKRARRAPRRRDDDMSLSAAPIRRSGAWCEEEASGALRLCFDIDIAEADSAACAALLHTGIPSIGAMAATEPREEAGGAVADQDVLAGGPVCGNDEAGPRQKGAKGGKKPREELPRGRPTQRTMQSLKYDLSPAQQRQGPSGSHASQEMQDVFIVQQPPLRMDFSNPTPKPVTQKPQALPTPLKSQALTSSQALTPAKSPLALHSSAATESMVEGLPIPLSAKARGKQKVPSEDVERTPSPGYLDSWINNSGSRERQSASHGRGVALDSPMDDLRIYFNVDPSPLRMHSSDLKISPQGLPSYPTAPAPAISPLSTSFPHAPEPQPHTPILYPTLVNEPYGDGTIDPALLGGGMPEPEVPVSFEPEMEDSYENQEEKDRMSSPSSPSTASSSSPEPAVPPLALTPPLVSPSPLRISQRQPVRRHIPDDMVPSDLLHSPTSSSSSSYADDRPPSPKAKPKATRKPKQTAVKRGVDKGGGTKVNDVVIPSMYNADGFFRYSGPPWPPGDPDAFCHQCRRKSKRLSMAFEDCNHVYCIGYPPNTVAFAATSPHENCPKCSDVCSCDHCTSRRGEEYQYSRHRRPIDETELIPRVPRTPGVARAQHNPYEILDQMVIEPTTFFATLYDLNGEPFARTFLGADGNTDFVVAKPIKRRRVFIGAVQEQWHLGPDPLVSLEPTPKSKRKLEGKPRYYIGKESVLSIRLRPLPSLPSLSPAPAPVIQVEDLVVPPEAATTTPTTPLAAAMDVDLPEPAISCDATSVAPTTPPRALVDVGSPEPVISRNATSATPTTPPRAPVNLPSPFASPLTSVADSETAAEDDAQGASEKARDQSPRGASEVVAVGDAECGSLKANDDTHDATAGPEGCDDANQGESGPCPSLYAADGADVPQPLRTHEVECSDAGLAGPSSFTEGPVFSLTDGEVAKAIFCAFSALATPTVVVRDSPPL